MRSNQFKGTVAFAALAIILSARAETRVVETVEEFKEALAYMNGRHSQSDTIVLKAGRYAVDSLNEPYYNGATGVKAIVPSNANFGFS